MPSLKLAISPPLEAGPSLLDSHNLPPRIPQALEHISERLAARALHASFVLVRRDCQLPPFLMRSSSTVSSMSSSSSSYSHSRHANKHGPSPFSPITPTSPAPSSDLERFTITTSLRKQLSNLRSRGSSSPSSPAVSSPRFLWPSRRRAASPLAGCREDAVMSPSPVTPSSMWSPSQASSVSPWMPATPHSPRSASPPLAVRLIYVPFKDAKSEDFLVDLIRKAERKFQVRFNAIPSNSSETELLLRNSLKQSRAFTSCASSSALFSSEGVTVVSLDGLYAFKSSLAAHARCPTVYSLQDATDELHRLVVSRGGKKVAKADVLRSYDWLGAPAGALAEVENEYRRVYALGGGGPFSGGGFVVDEKEEAKNDEAKRDSTVSEMSECETTVTEDEDSEEFYVKDDEKLEMMLAQVVAIQPMTATATTTGPRALRIQTNFDQTGRAPALAVPTLVAPELPRRNPLRGNGGFRRGGVVIDSFPGFGFGIGLGLMPLKSPTESIMSKKPEDRTSYRLGPKTPNAYEDITPVTRGEWRLLMSDGMGANTAAVETCV